jgi:hypothetical protein
MLAFNYWQLFIITDRQSNRQVLAGDVPEIKLTESAYSRKFK